MIAVLSDILLRKELQLPISNSYFWTDSLIVLSIILNTEKRFKVFVANRLTTIHTFTDAHQWKHISSSENLADELSRGMSAEELINSSRWPRGPEFLRSTQAPGKTATIEDKHVPDEWHVTQAKQSFSAQAEENFTTTFIHYFSDWERLLKSVAWLRRIVSWIRAGRPKAVNERTLTVKEVWDAEIAIVKFTQADHLTASIEAIREGCLKKSSQIFKLEPTLDANGVSRTGGRFEVVGGNRVVQPMILPKKQPCRLPHHKRFSPKNASFR